jgi:hypothetical protein
LDGFYFLQNILCNPRTSKDVSELVLSQGLVSVVLIGISMSREANYLRSACGILANLAFGDAGRKHICDDEESPSKILSILDLNIDIDIIKSALYILKLLMAEKETLGSQCVQHNVITRVLHLVESHPNDNCFIMSGLSLIADLLRNEQRSLLVDKNEFLTITTQISGHRRLGCVLYSILRRLDVTSVGTDTAKHAIRQILAVLRRPSSDESVQFEMCHALLNIFSQYPSLLSMLKTSDIPKTHSPAIVIYDGIDTMSETSGEDAKSKPAKEHAIVTCDEVSNKIKAIINKALRHESDHKAQVKAFEHLRKLIVDEESAEKVCEKVLQLGGVDMITLAMKVHPDKSVVQAEASATLSDLAWKYPMCSRKLFDHGCLSLVVQAMNTYTNHAKVQLQGCGFFRTLSYENENHYFINSANGFEAVLDSMSNNPKKRDVVKESC